MSCFDSKFKRYNKTPFGKVSRVPAIAIIVVLLVCAGLAVGACCAFGVIDSSNDDFVISSSSRSSSVSGSSGESFSQDSTISRSKIYIHVAGAVANPGLYTLPEDSRVNDAIEAAGGFSENANKDSLNLARVLTDGEQVNVPVVQSENASALESDAGSGDGSTVASAAVSSKVNINTASEADLDALPGIGPSTAKKIVADRTANGSFKSIDDLSRVSGIGDKKLEALRDYITV